MSEFAAAVADKKEKGPRGQALGLSRVGAASLVWDQLRKKIMRIVTGGQLAQCGAPVR